LGFEFAGCLLAGAASLFAAWAAYYLAFSMAELVWFWVTFITLATCSFYETIT